MTPFFIEATQTQNGWQSVFAFQIFLRSIDEWLKMRWGFNPGTLLEEALDRSKLFLESQTTSDEFSSEDEESNRTLVLRCFNLSGIGLQFTLMGKVTHVDREQSLLAGETYAREIFSTFPNDFVLIPAIAQKDFDRLVGKDFFSKKLRIAAIQREKVFIPPMLRHQYMPGLWQTTPRANEQTWRALSAVSNNVALNIMLRPSTLYQNEKELLLDIKKKFQKSSQDDDIFSSHIGWVNSYIKRRLDPWRRLFQMQVHVLAENEPDESLLRSAGTAFTRSVNETPTPGFQIACPNSSDEETQWLQQIRSLDFIPPQRRMDDIADVDEVHAVFRLPYRQEAGLHGVSLIELPLTAHPPSEFKHD